MSRRKIKKCDEGTAYAAALLHGDRVGAAHCSDAELMAAFCEDCLQVLAGAVSGRLVWEGAQARGMTALELQRVAHDRDLRMLDKLMFDPPARKKRSRSAVA